MMGKLIKGFLVSLLYENGAPSRPGLVGTIAGSIAPLVWLILSIHLYASGYEWKHYDTFTAGAGVTTLTGGAILGGNKFMNTQKALAGQPIVKGIPENLPYGSLKDTRAGGAGPQN